MKLILIMMLSFVASACSDGFSNRDRVTIAELQSDVKDLKEQLRIANEKSNGCPEKTTENLILHLPPKLYSSEIDKRLSEIELLKPARAVTFYLYPNTEDQYPYRVSVVIDYRDGRVSFDAVNPLVISDFLKNNGGTISIEMPSFLYPDERKDQAQLLAFKQAMLAVFNDYSEERQRIAARAEALTEPLTAPDPELIKSALKKWSEK